MKLIYFQFIDNHLKDSLEQSNPEFEKNFKFIHAENILNKNTCLQYVNSNLLKSNTFPYL